MARQSADVKYQVREFLCPQEEEVNSYIDAKVKLDVEAYDDGVISRSLDANITFADCHRTVSWDFGIWCYGGKTEHIEEEKVRVRAKLRKARRIINAFFDSLEDALKELKEDTPATKTVTTPLVS